MTSILRHALWLPLLAPTLALTATAADPGQQPKPTWELGTSQIDPATAQGKVDVVDGVLKLDCANSFAIPVAALGSQNDYTIELEFRRPPGFKNLPRMNGALRLFTNREPVAHAGLTLVYFPPAWDLNGGVGNAMGMEINGYWNAECGGLDGDGFNKYSIVVKDRMPSIYRNGLLLAMTGEVKPSGQPLIIGGTGWRGAGWAGGDAAKPPTAEPVPEPYELRALRVYDQALPPTGYDRSAEVMRNCAGDGYTMQRADIKDPTLPRILVIGDSISMGYRGFISKQFKGKAYVDYWVGGAWFAWTIKGDDFPLLPAFSAVLANGPYDVVSWNSMTLHMWANNDNGRCLPETFPGQMTQVVEHLKKTAPNTKFIWVRCTPVTAPVEGGPSVIVADGPNKIKSERIDLFNKMTDEIMTKYGIPEVDLHALCVKNLDKASKDGVHWQASAYELMAAEISKEIEKNLPATRRQEAQK